MPAPHLKTSAPILRLLLALACLASLLAAQTHAQTTTQTNAPPDKQKPKAFQWMQYADTAEAGWSQTRLDAIRDQARTMNTACYMIIDHGIIVETYGDVTREYKCHSIRKSLLSALIGIHVDEGTIDLDQTLAQLKIDDVHKLSALEKTATVHDLLKSRSGVYHPAAYESKAMKEKGKPDRDSKQPGTHWFYNNWDFNTLGHIVKTQTGNDLFADFEERIAKPLMMEDFTAKDGKYVYEKDLSLYPAYTFRMSSRDLARFGLLYLNKGNWQGEQIIPKSWIEASFKRHSKNYGYMWWVGRVGKHEVYSAVGSGGHKLYIDPTRQLVFVHRMDTDNKQRVASSEVSALFKLVTEARTGKRSDNLEVVPFHNRK